MTQQLQKQLPPKNEHHMDVFVYGTLKKGFGNHHFLEAAYFMGTASVPGILLSLGGFPGLILEENGWNVKGEVWRINKELDLPALDRLEGHPSHYTRKEITIQGYGLVSTYEYNPKETVGYHYECLPSGEWKGRPDFNTTAKWVGVFSKAHSKEYVPSYGLYLDETSGFRAVVDLQTGEIVVNGGLKKPHFTYDTSNRKWVPKDTPKIITGTSEDSRNHGDLHKPPVVLDRGWEARQHMSASGLPVATTYTPPPKPPKYVDPADPGEEDADGSTT